LKVPARKTDVWGTQRREIENRTLNTEGLGTRRENKNWGRHPGVEIEASAVDVKNRILEDEWCGCLVSGKVPRRRTDVWGTRRKTNQEPHA
jgi:hypothetical protein